MKKKYLLLLSFCVFSIFIYAGSDVIKLSPKMKVITVNKDDELKQKFSDWQKHFVDIQILTDKDKIEETPRVVSDKEGKVLSIEKDFVYINNLANVNFQKPMAAYRLGAAILDPITKKNLGYPFYYLSNTDLIQYNIENNLSLLQLSKVNTEVIIGDRILNKLQESTLSFDKLRKNKSNVKGQISSIIAGVKRAEHGQNVILDIGKKDKIKPGDLLQVKKQLTIKRSIQLHENAHFTPDSFVYRKRDKNTGKKIELPKESIATLLVYRVFDNTSLAMVIESNEPVQLKQEVVGFNK